MAVEKSYARLGLFLVIAHRRDPRDRAALHPADAEPRSHRARHLYAGERQPVSTSRARCATAASPSGGCRTCRWSRAAARSRSTSSCSPIASPPSAPMSATSRSWPDRAVFRAAARSGGGQPRDRRGLPLSRHAGEPPSADDARLHAKSAIHPVDADADCGSYGIGCPKCWSASRRRSRSFGRSSPDARQPRPGRPVLHQRRTHRPRERAAGPQRRLAEVLLDDQHADRGRSPRT